MKVRAPGKILFSGEYSVLHGGSALAVSINKYTQVTLHSQERQYVTLHLPNITQSFTKSFDELTDHYQTIDQQFSSDPSYDTRLSSSTVNACDLFFYGVIHFLIENHILPLTHGFEIEIISDIPLRCGMGSSASSLTALLAALYHFFSLSYEKNHFIQQTGYIERLQHACISRIDPAITLLGGSVLYRNKVFDAVSVPLDHRWHLINTGCAHSSTGTCIQQVHKKIQPQDTIWNAFQASFSKLYTGLLYQDAQMIYNAIVQNNTLLEKIGVVPTTVQRFIARLAQQYQIATKITGAGSVSGEQAGVLLAYNYGDLSFNHLRTLCHQHGYLCEPLTPSNTGVTFQ